MGELRDVIDHLQGRLLREGWRLRTSLESTNRASPPEQQVEIGSPGRRLQRLSDRELLVCTQHVLAARQDCGERDVDHELKALRVPEEGVPQSECVRQRGVLGEEQRAPTEGPHDRGQLALLEMPGQLWVVGPDQLSNAVHKRVHALASVVHGLHKPLFDLGHKLAKTPERISLCSFKFRRHNVINDCRDLVHTLHVADARIKARIHEQQ
mmetsp:Transcript_46737/g.130135  ORF Transcript_46737/g.130135 Transcript_46737/m.130135 type:complete len:210 (+) Transcript_46737:690-1319(+)